MTTINIKSGEYRKQPVRNMQFRLVKGFQTSKKGSYVTVKNEGHFPIAIDEIKIKVNHIADIDFLEGEPVTAAATLPKITETETDAEAMDRIATRFKILDEMASACINGDVRAMIVSGPPGVGKSYGVEQQLEKASMFDRISGNRIRYNVVKGAMTALGLYSQLYKYSDKKNILVFDDCDSVFMDDLALNILKAALDSGKSRKICWNSDSALLRREGIPDSFNFNGSAIFITNLKFENVRSKKLQDHLEALESRCHFLDLTIDSERDKMLRIRQVHRDATNGLFGDYHFADGEGAVILDFMEQNKTKLRELSIRMALKVADLVKMSPTNWRVLAQNTVFKRG
jgi:predicted AAA+ superfamily ATPase